METKKHKRDRGRLLGKLLADTFVRARSKFLRSSNDETAPLLKKNSSSKSGEHDDAAIDSSLDPKLQTPVTYKEAAYPELLLNTPHLYSR